jgi:carbon storage regulator
MLILTRKVGQAILIGPDVAITVLNVRGDRVKLGIEAPAMVEILRQELAAQIQEANLQASSSGQLSHLLPTLVASLRPGRGLSESNSHPAASELPPR